MIGGTLQEPDPAHLEGIVLIIDDDDLIARSLRHLLLERGGNIDLARDRAVAEELLALRRYDLVIVDPFLTGEVQGDGALVATIRRLQPDVPLVILSAYTSPALVAAPAFRATIVRKPQPLPFLASLVAGLLRTGSHRNAPEGSETTNREVKNAT